MKGTMKFGDTVIEFESSSPEDIAKVTSVVALAIKGKETPATTEVTHTKSTARTTLTEAERREKKRIASLRWYYSHKDYYKKRRANTATETTGKSTRKRATYLEWTEADIVRVAALVSLGGGSIAEINNKVYDMLRNEGDVKNRTKDNLYVYVQRVYRYIHLGKQFGLAKSTIKVLNKNGFHKGMRSQGSAPFMSGRLIPIEA